MGWKHFKENEIVMNGCKYCASYSTPLDKFGYCKKYSCLERSGKAEILKDLSKKASDIYFMSDTYGQIGRVVTNSYSHRHREADRIKTLAIKEFGFVPSEITERIPMKYRKGDWDKSIRW